MYQSAQRTAMLQSFRTIGMVMSIVDKADKGKIKVDDIVMIAVLTDVRH